MKPVSIALIALALGYVVHGEASEAQTESVVYSFCSQQNCPDGRNPLAGVIDVNGALYGTTAGGGADSNGGPGGTVFSLNPQTGGETVLYSFCSQQNCTDGGYPVAGLLDVNGTLYGTTLSGGSAKFCGEGCGTVFSLATGAETVVYSFCSQTGCTDGYYPVAGVIDVKGVLYGTNQDGGKYGNGGTVFSLDLTTGKEGNPHSFRNSLGDGFSPEAGLIDVDGALYGTTSSGGAAAKGAVFSLKGGGKNAFHPYGLADGFAPLSALLEVNGTLYGTTSQGGSGNGTLFSLDPKTGVVATLYSFGGNKDGTHPAAALIDVTGILYGTTSAGGSYGGGTVFSFDPTTGAERVLYSFCSEAGCTDGEYPRAGLINVNGTLYGTTYSGGKYDYGAVFAILPAESPGRG